MSTHTFADVDEEQNKKDAEEKKPSVETKSSNLSTYTPDAEGGPSPEDYNIEHIQILGRSSQFDPEGGEIGDICVNKETPLGHVNEPVRCVLVHTRKYWKENIPYDDETIPRFANTLEEKAHIEQTTEFAGTVPVCDVTVLLERPESFENDESASGVFIYEFGGKEYALVKYTVQKSQAVRENYGTINVATRARATKGDDAGKYYFELKSKEKGAGTKYKWHQFVLSGTAQDAPQEAADFARSLRGE